MVDAQRAGKSTGPARSADTAGPSNQSRSGNAFERERAGELFMMMGDVARLSRCIDIITEKANAFSQGTIPLSCYTSIARNMKPFRSWGNYIRSMDEDGLEATQYSAQLVGTIRRNLDKAISIIERTDERLQKFQKTSTAGELPSYDRSTELRTVGANLIAVGNRLDVVMISLPREHRAVDFISSNKDGFKLDVIARPIAAMHNTCVHVLDALAELDAHIQKNAPVEEDAPAGKDTSFGGVGGGAPAEGDASVGGKSRTLRNSELQLRSWGISLVQGQAPLDTYLEIGGWHTEDDAQFLYDGFSMLLYHLYELLRERLPLESLETSFQGQDDLPAELQDCHFYYTRVVYLLNQDFMFFPASERWADRMITQLSEPTPYHAILHFVVDAQKGIDDAIDILYKVTEFMIWRALDMEANLPKWEHGDLWEESCEQVNRKGEGAQRVVQRESILTKALSAGTGAGSGTGSGSAARPAPKVTVDSLTGQLSELEARYKPTLATLRGLADSLDLPQASSSDQGQSSSRTTGPLEKLRRTVYRFIEPGAKATDAEKLEIQTVIEEFRNDLDNASVSGRSIETSLSASRMTAASARTAVSNVAGTLSDALLFAESGALLQTRLFRDNDSGYASWSSGATAEEKRIKRSSFGVQSTDSRLADLDRTPL